MQFTIRCNGRVLGSTDLDFGQLAAGLHSGWLYPASDADDLVDAVSIGYASVRAWMTYRAMPPGSFPIVAPEYPQSRESHAISAAVAARLHYVLTLHRADGSELPTRGIVLQDRFFWPTPWLDEEDPFEGLDDAKRAELEAIVEHDLGVMREMYPERFTDTAEATDGEDPEDHEWRENLEASLSAAELSRYQVHVQLDHLHDLPSDFSWLGLPGA